MSYTNLSSKIITTSFLTVLTALIIFAGCSEMPGTSYDDNDELSVSEFGMEQSTMANSNASFPVFNQVFNHDTEPWATETEGEEELGWCGSIDLVDRRSGDLNPTAGRAYATLEHGVCNEFWSGVFPGITSAPATSKNPDLYSTEWPASGFIQQLDIYLDADYPAGNSDATFHDLFDPDAEYVFSYSNAIRDITLTEDGGELVVYYFEISVTKNDDQLYVGDHPIEEAGWHTFRHLFDSDSEGNLSVEFELVRNGQTLYSETIDESYFGVPASSLEVDDLGSAHIWFVSIADGLQLPVDQHRLRPGK